MDPQRIITFVYIIHIQIHILKKIKTRWQNFLWENLFKDRASYWDKPIKRTDEIMNSKVQLNSKDSRLAGRGFWKVSIGRSLMKDINFAVVTLVCEDDQPITAHNSILVASSPFFQNMLMKNKHTHTHCKYTWSPM